MPHTVALGPFEEEAYKSLYRQLLQDDNANGTLADLNTQLLNILNQLNQAPDETNKKRMADIEALNHQYQQLLENQMKFRDERFRFLPIFSSDPIVSIEVILPGGPDLKARIDQNELLKSFATAPPGQTTATNLTENTILSLGLARPLNSQVKINYSQFSISIDQTDKMVICSKKDKNDPVPFDQNAVRNLQKHVLASVVRNPHAPINIKFPLDFDEHEKFKILNEMMIAYALRTDVQGRQSPKDSIKRRNQFIEQLINGGTILLSDTVDKNGLARLIDTWDMWSMKEKKNHVLSHYSKDTTELSQDYKEQLRTMFRVEAMRQIAEGENVGAEIANSISQNKAQTYSWTIVQKLYEFKNVMMDPDGKAIPDEQYRIRLKGVLAELVDLIKDNYSSLNFVDKIEINKNTILLSKPYQALSEFGIQADELEEFLNSPKIKSYIETNQPHQNSVPPRMP